MEIIRYVSKELLDKFIKGDLSLIDLLKNSNIGETSGHYRARDIPIEIRITPLDKE